MPNYSWVHVKEKDILVGVSVFFKKSGSSISREALVKVVKALANDYGGELAHYGYQMIPNDLQVDLVVEFSDLIKSRRFVIDMKKHINSLQNVSDFYIEYLIDSKEENF